jgi:hypothetical protein
MFLIIYIYAVIGINLFGEVKIITPMTTRLNFMNVFNAIITLFRVATGEGWNDLMDVLSMEKGF